MAKFINTFKILPKELFRVNNGPSIRLRAWPTKPKGSYDLLTEAGKVKPKGLDSKSYAAPNGASMRPNTALLKRLVTTFKGSNVIIYSVPAGTKLPGDLLLVHEHCDHYSLQAATEMTVEELNSKITTFLTNYGKTLTKDEWLQKYPQPTETS
ncbi:hypothetical protein MMC16_003754 [Acarospora aff. strigata]|nr:hypothetical protein [Acarospora aff. strigata]